MVKVIKMFLGRDRWLCYGDNHFESVGNFGNCLQMSTPIETHCWHAQKLMSPEYDVGGLSFKKFRILGKYFNIWNHSLPCVDMVDNE